MDVDGIPEKGRVQTHIRPLHLLDIFFFFDVISLALVIVHCNRDGQDPDMVMSLGNLQISCHTDGIQTSQKELLDDMSICFDIRWVSQDVFDHHKTTKKKTEVLK